MENVCHKYVLQVAKAKETLGTLEEELYIIRIKLKDHPTHSDYLKELKRVTLDMTITLNELEHSQYMLDECELRLRTEEKYND